MKLLSECHWTSSCVITMKRFQELCGGPDEASAVLSHLVAQAKARYLSLSKGDLIEVGSTSTTCHSSILFLCNYAQWICFLQL